ncbi:MAG: FliO/MopB family protein [Bdellovibrionia bacterium]
MKKLVFALFFLNIHFAYAETDAAAAEAAEMAALESEIALAQEVSNSTSAEEGAAAQVKEEENAKEIVDTKKAENEIPLNFDKQKKTAGDESPLFKILLSFSIIGLVGTGAFIFLRKYSLPKQAKFQTPIKVLQQHYLGPKKSLAIVHVAGESILIGITDHNISHIKTLALLDEELPAVANDRFDGVLKGMGDDKDFADPAEADDEEFAMGGIREVVARRLRNMRSIE